MEEYRHDLGDDYIPFINMIDINSNEQLPRPRPEQQSHKQHYLMRVAEQQPTSWLTSCSGSSKQQLRVQHRTSSSHLGGDEGEGGEETSKKESEVTLTDISSSRTILVTQAIRNAIRANRFARIIRN